MTLNAALWASSTALTGKAALALWVTALLFQYCDLRKIAIVWQVFIALSISLLSLAAYANAGGTITKSTWMTSCAIASIVATMHIRDWLRTSPRETFEEVASVDATSKKQKKKSVTKSNALSAPSAFPRAAGTRSTVSKSTVSKSAVHWYTWLGVMISGWSLTSSVLANGSARSSALFAAVHVLAACVLLGVALFCAIELTFGSAPSSLSAISWSSVAFVALICWVAELGIAASIVLTPVDATADFQVAAMSRMFAISVMVIDFVVWMIPFRLATFQRSGKAVAWVSLAIAAWTGVLSLTLLCALPTHWPWR